MATVKIKKVYVCSSCNKEYPKMAGKCQDCGEWNTISEKEMIVENKSATKTVGSIVAATGYSNLSKEIKTLSNVESVDSKRVETSWAALNNLFGRNGIVEGSVNLISGEPGIGKSTFLLQLINDIAVKDYKTLYISGEESDVQINLRAMRLNLNRDIIHNLNDNNLENVIKTLREFKPRFIVVDSIQTIYSELVPSNPGSVSQVTTATASINAVCKELGITAFIVGHVTKDGGIAGPKVIEHMVDAIFSFEGDSSSNYRSLRAIKNRNASTEEMVILEMKEEGLNIIEDASLLFLDEYGNNFQTEVGSVIFAGIENNQSLLLEVQSLVNFVESGGGKKIGMGVEYNRIAIILGIISKELGSNKEVMKTELFVKLASTIKMNDSGIDLPILLSIVSNLQNKPVKESTAVFGEMSLSGKLKLGRNFEKRINMVNRAKIKNIIMPMIKDDEVKNEIINKYKNINFIMCNNINEAIYKIFQ